jgi:hypothetical protein
VFDGYAVCYILKHMTVTSVTCSAGISTSSVSANKEFHTAKTMSYFLTCVLLFVMQGIQGELAVRICLMTETGSCAIATEGMHDINISYFWAA